MRKNILDGAEFSSRKESVRDFFRAMQKRNVVVRLKKDPQTYTKMINARWEKAEAKKKKATLDETSATSDGAGQGK